MITVVDHLSLWLTPRSAFFPEAEARPAGGTAEITILDPFV